MRRTIALLLVALVVGAIAFPATAVDDPREEPARTDPPVRVYAGETLNISAVELSGNGEPIGADPTTFRAVGSESTFTVEDPTAADFDGIETGSYYVENDSDVQAELSVRRGAVDSIELRDQREVTVTNGRSDPEHLETLSIRARYNFDAVDRLDVTVTGPDGIEVATGRITRSGDRITVDLGAPTPGVYTVTAVGSNVDSASRTVTVRVTGATPTATATATPTPPPTTTATATPTATDIPTATSPEPTPTTTTTVTPEPATTRTEGNGPGFGIVAAVVALLSITTLARRP